MTILLLGAGPRLAWVRSVLDAARARAPVSAQPLSAVPEIRVLEGLPTRDLLVSLAAGTIDSLILIDHGLFSAGPPPAAVDPAEAIRGEAQRAVFAVELARRAARTLVLSGGNAQAWIASLATLLAVPLPADLL